MELEYMTSMTKTKEQTIEELGSKFDPRSVKWENKAILDTLQEEPEDVNATDLCAAINERYDCELFSYQSLYKNLQSLNQQGIIGYNALTKRYSISKEHITFEVKYLPISNFCVGLFGLSILILIGSMYIKNVIMINATTGAVLVGALYLLGQYMGSEFKLNGSITLFLMGLKNKIYRNKQR